MVNIKFLSWKSYRCHRTYFLMPWKWRLKRGGIWARAGNTRSNHTCHNTSQIFFEVSDGDYAGTRCKNLCPTYHVHVVGPSIWYGVGSDKIFILLPSMGAIHLTTPKRITHVQPDNIDASASTLEEILQRLPNIVTPPKGKEMLIAEELSISSHEI